MAATNFKTENNSERRTGKMGMHNKQAPDTTEERESECQN
jgi:hypothetical protein